MFLKSFILCKFLNFVRCDIFNDIKLQSIFFSNFLDQSVDLATASLIFLQLIIFRAKKNADILRIEFFRTVNQYYINKYSRLKKIYTVENLYFFYCILRKIKISSRISPVLPRKYFVTASHICATKF